MLPVIQLVHEEVQISSDLQHLRSRGSSIFWQKNSFEGILYRSVRHEKGECVAALKTTVIKAPAMQGAHYELHWDGKEFTHISKIENKFLVT